METTGPTRLDEFCKVFGIDFFDLQLSCIFCKFVCNLEDLAAFHKKNLSIVYRYTVPFACCLKCLKHTALYERQRFSLCSVKPSVIDVLTGKSFFDLPIRCLFCLSLLDPIERKEACLRNDDVILVRGHWRCICRVCFSNQYEIE